MLNAKEIKDRIKGVENTRKITNAMYMIASSKMKKAKNDLDRTRPYFDALHREVKRVFRTVEGIENRYFYPADGSEAPDGTYGLLVITTDKGLAGAYNKSVIKEAQRLINEHPDTRLFVVGEYGRRFFTKHRYPIEKTFSTPPKTRPWTKQGKSAPSFWICSTKRSWIRFLSYTAI